MQKGSLIRSSRRQGPDVWEYRWRESCSGEKRKHRRIVIGSLDTLRDESAALKAISALRRDININDRRMKTKPLRLAELIEHFRQRELAADNEWKTLSTRVTYEGYLRKWIVPRWGATNLSAIRAVEVELWLRTLPLARASRAKIRNLMRCSLTTRDDTTSQTTIPSPSSAKAQSGALCQKCSCLPKSTYSFTVCGTERGLLFSWLRARGFA